MTKQRSHLVQTIMMRGDWITISPGVLFHDLVPEVLYRLIPLQHLAVLTSGTIIVKQLRDCFCNIAIARKSGVNGTEFVDCELQIVYLYLFRASSILFTLPLFPICFVFYIFSTALSLSLHTSLSLTVFYEASLLEVRTLILKMEHSSHPFLYHESPVPWDNQEYNTTLLISSKRSYRSGLSRGTTLPR